jgi:Zn-dependent M28 family amino/carboxypeptidase
MTLVLAVLLASNASPAIRPAALRAHVKFLADDLLEGRGTATRGHEIAARYVAAHFEAMGLLPAGQDGTFFQEVPLRSARLVAEESSLTLARGGRERTLRAVHDYALAPDTLRQESEVAAPVVFVGFGVVAPELDHDDYAGVDVRGKIVALLTGAPARFPNDQRAYYSSAGVKAEAAASRGALGVLAIQTPEDAKRVPFSRTVEALEAGVMRWVDGQGNPAGVAPGLRASAALSRDGALALFEGAARSLDEAFADAAAAKVASFALAAEARLRTRSRHQDVRSPNVLAVLRGRDPALAKEHVVLSAHLDHLGIGVVRDGDAIYNGAFDNASGTAALLEIARAFAALSRPPRRSILFAAVTAEEKGLLGAEYFARNPTVEASSIVANFNMDMFLSLFPAKDVIAFGAEHSSLGGVAKDLAGRLDLTLAPDPFPEEVIFIRSDHYAFVRQGIPSLMLSAGLRSTTPGVDGPRLFGQWLGRVYHSPKDDASQAIDFDSAAKVARLYFLMAEKVAGERERPSWKPGDFFGTKFGR